MNAQEKFERSLFSVDEDSVEKTAAAMVEEFTAEELVMILKGGDLSKLAAMQTEKERAHQWGKNGALINTLGGGLPLLTGLQVAQESGSPALGVLMGARNAVIHGGVGYGLGRGVHRLVHGPATDKKVKKSSANEELVEAAEQWGRELAVVGNEKEKKAGPMGALQKGVGTVARTVAKAPALARIGGGAAAGAVAGAATGRGDQVGQNGVVPGNRLGRAIAGGVMGGAAGHFAPQAIKAVGGANNAAGKYLSTGITHSAATAGDKSGLQLARGMHAERASKMRGQAAAGMAAFGGPNSVESAHRAQALMGASSQQSAPHSVLPRTPPPKPVASPVAAQVPAQVQAAAGVQPPAHPGNPMAQQPPAQGSHFVNAQVGRPTAQTLRSPEETKSLAAQEAQRRLAQRPQTRAAIGA